MGFLEWIVLAGVLLMAAGVATFFRLAGTSTSAKSRTSSTNISRSPVRGIGQRVLVVDDSATIRKVIELTLLQSPLQVVEANTDAEARKLLNQDVFALALIDAHLSEQEGGCELARFCQQVSPQTPILLMRGKFEAEIDSSSGFGAQAILEKPFDAKELLARVQQLTGVGSSS